MLNRVQRNNLIGICGLSALLAGPMVGDGTISVPDTPRSAVGSTGDVRTDDAAALDLDPVSYRCHDVTYHGSLPEPAAVTVMCDEYAMDFTIESGDDFVTEQEDRNIRILGVEMPDVNSDGSPDKVVVTIQQVPRSNSSKVGPLCYELHKEIGQMNAFQAPPRVTPTTCLSQS